MCKTIESIVAEFEKEYEITLSKIQRKKIIYEGQTITDKSIVVVMPSSKIYDRGNGWVDFTKIQIDIFKEYSIALAVFRLSNESTYYINLQELFPLLTKENMLENEREGQHWKIDIWKNKLVIRNGNNTLNVEPNKKGFIRGLINNKQK